jgi:hypothetical protein
VPQRAVCESTQYAEVSSDADGKTLLKCAIRLLQVHGMEKSERFLASAVALLNSDTSGAPASGYFRRWCTGTQSPSTSQITAKLKR